MTFFSLPILPSAGASEPYTRLSLPTTAENTFVDTPATTSATAVSKWLTTPKFQGRSITSSDKSMVCQSTSPPTPTSGVSPVLSPYSQCASPDGSPAFQLGSPTSGLGFGKPTSGTAQQRWYTWSRGPAYVSVGTQEPGPVSALSSTDNSPTLAYHVGQDGATAYDTYSAFHAPPSSPPNSTPALSNRSSTGSVQSGASHQATPSSALRRLSSESFRAFPQPSPPSSPPFSPGRPTGHFTNQHIRPLSPLQLQLQTYKGSTTRRISLSELLTQASASMAAIPRSPGTPGLTKDEWDRKGSVAIPASAGSSRRGSVNDLLRDDRSDSIASPRQQSAGGAWGAITGLGKKMATPGGWPWSKGPSYSRIMI